ncbi:MAG: hypothetical protein ACO32I_02080 [Candidatus Limnocylindrus sp.]
MYNAHDFDPRIPLHKRSLKKLASVSADEAVKLVRAEEARSDELSDAYKAYSTESGKVSDPLYKAEKDLDKLSPKERSARMKAIQDQVDKDARVAPLKSKYDAAVAAKKSASDAYEAALDRAKMPTGDAAYYGLSKEDAQKKIPKGSKGEYLSKIHSSKLTFGQNLRALGHEAKQLSYTPGAVIKRGWNNLGEGGGGWVGGPQAGRYLPLGGKSLGGVAALGDFKDAVNRSDPMGEGRSRAERLGSAAGGTLGGLVTGLSARTMGRLGTWPGLGVAVVGGIGGYMGGSYLGGKIGKGVDALSSPNNRGDYVASLRRRGGA